MTGPGPQSHEQQDLRDLIEDLEARGITSRAEQAAALGMTLRTLQRRRAAAGLPPAREPLKAWIPWKITKEHSDELVARRLRRLAQAADRRPTPYETHRAKAVIWARDLVADGLDITYTRRDGFKVIRAKRGDWYLKRLLDAAMDYLTGHPDVSEAGHADS